MLPDRSHFLSHPIDFMTQWVHVYKLHMEHISAETAEKRRRDLDDVERRRQYRKAHGMEQQGGLAGWTGLGAIESPGVRVKAEEPVPGGEKVVVGGETDAVVASGIPEGTQEGYRDFEGKQKKPVKKWLGIW